MFVKVDHRKPRAYTVALLDEAEQGNLDWEQIARRALDWMSEDEVREFAEANFAMDEDEDDEFDGQPDEAQEWHDFDPDC